MQTDLRSVRKQRGWTLKDLSELSHVDIATISRIEAGITRNPSNATVAALEVALKLKRGTLVFGEQVEARAS